MTRDLSKCQAVAILLIDGIDMPAIGESVMVKSGAKLYRIDRSYFILSGYAQDGSDIFHYKF